MNLSSWQVALRIARRDALRAKGRSALIVAMVALPVLGVAGADVVYRSAQLEPRERIERLMGTSDALVTAFSPGHTVQQAPIVSDGSSILNDVAGKPPTPEEVRSASTDPAELATSLLPPGSRLASAQPGPEASARSRDGLLRTATSEADLTDPLWTGRIDVIQGHAPSAPSELAVTQAFLDQSGLSLGATTTVKGLDNRTYTLTAVAEYPGDLSKVEIIGRPGELVAPLAALPTPDTTKSSETDSTANPPTWLVRLPAGSRLDWAKVQEFNRYGFTVTSRSVALDPPARSAVPYYRSAIVRLDTGTDSSSKVVVATAAGMALLETALLAGPAFAVGARRSRRQLALLAAGGGDRSQVRAVVLGAGVVLGLTGAVGGVLVGTGVVAALRPWIEQTAGSRFGHFNLHPLDLLAIAAVGLATALLAAVLPAIQAAREDVVTALNGRVTAKAASRRIAALGLVLVAAGALAALLGAGSSSGLPVVGGYDAQTLAVLGGSVTAELGMLVCTPALIGLLGRLARHLPLGPRLALRDAARQRGRTAPAVAAVLAAVAGAVAVGVYTTSSDAQARSEYRAQAPSGAVTLLVSARAPLAPVRSAIEQGMPDLGARADVGQVTYTFCPNCSSNVSFLPAQGGPGGSGPSQFANSSALTGDATALHNFFGVHDPAAEAALAAGKAVVFKPGYVKDGKAVFQLRGAAGGPPLQPGQTPQTDNKQLSLDAVFVDDAVAAGYGTGLVSADTVQRLGLSSTPMAEVWLPAVPPTAKAEQQTAAAVGHIDSFASLSVERGYQPTSDLVTLALSGFAALVVVGAAAIATGLAAADSRNDQVTLAAVGAPPRIRRVLSGLQCGLIATVGAALGTVCGFVPAVALRRARDVALNGASSPITVPWTLILLTVVVLPIVAALLATATTRSRLPLTRRPG
ncbi:FtsX-like permease family protein [Kitasatospora mediocidica]|uniref:FtsX-like permease family protein n=1 Tax=Kitasatospora mediocidica TaxID=58352 RepID=UPI000562699F|nr:FtsX-like permease family protein [Kitasatospora mediocidica]